MKQPPKLVTHDERANEAIVKALEDFKDLALKHKWVGVGLTVVTGDGRVFTIAKHAHGRRALLLGAITDLQFEVANAGNNDD